MNRFYLFSLRFIRRCGLLWSVFCMLMAFLTTCYTADMETQIVLFRMDFFPAGLLGCGFFLLCYAAICRLVLAKPCRKKILLGLVFLWCVGVGFGFLFFGRTLPAADSMSVFSLAEELADGNLSVIHPTDSYISYYPQQIGLVAFYELLIRLWQLLPFGMRAYPFLQVCNILCVCVIVYAQYKTVHLLFQNDRTDCLYLLLIGCNLPFLLYTSFVYGEIPSFAAFAVGSYFLLLLCRTKEHLRRHALLSLCAFTLSVMLRKNALILILAVLVVAFLQGLRERRAFFFGYALLVCLAAFSILPLLQKGYEVRSGNEIRSGVPASAYFAMGMQQAPRAPGWYNGFNFNTYRDSGMDSAATAKKSREAIHERLSYFGTHPKEALLFYAKKIASQWSDGTYACRQATYATSSGRRGFIWSLYSGEGAWWLIAYCNAYQNLFYLGAFVFALFVLQKGKRPSDDPVSYLGLIGILGGFLFHLIWEANARYSFPYVLLFLPYAARGIDHIWTIFAAPKTTARKVSLPILLFSLLGCGILAYSTHRHPADMREQLKRLQTEDYEAFFVSMYPIAQYREEDFSHYLGMPSLVLSTPFTTGEELSLYLQTAFRSAKPISHVYLGIDPAILWDNSKYPTDWAHVLSECLIRFLHAHPDTHFDLLLPHYALSYWLNLTRDETQRIVEHTISFAHTLADFENVSLYMLAQEEWLIANPDNYVDAYTTDADIAKRVFLLTFCDHVYEATAAQIAENARQLGDFVNNQRQTPTLYPDLSCLDIVFFGDSVIANQQDASSIPGIVTGLTKARTYNCAQGGTTATDCNPEIFSFHPAITCFLAGPAAKPPAAEGFYASCERFWTDDHHDKTLCFVINYGLNDYFNGCPLENPNNPMDIATYAGALRSGIERLKSAYPDAQFVLLSPTFTQLFDNGTQRNAKNGGVLLDYVNTAVAVAKALDIPFLNQYADLGISESNCSRYLADGTHPNEQGRFWYATHLIRHFADAQ